MTNKLGLKDTTAMRPEDLGDPELLAVRPGRTNPEFASTCKPAFLSYMMESGSVGKDELLTFIDDDFYFYQSAQELFEKAHASGSIIVTPHRFPPEREHEIAAKGRYNAGIVLFRNDPEARRCLSDWRKQCLDWCYLRYENGQIGDQGYLSDWPKKYNGVYELTDKGVNLSTWNIKNYHISRNADGSIMIDDQPLICYHFHGLKIYKNKAGRILAYPISVYDREIYEPCIQALDAAYKELHSIDPSWDHGLAPRLNIARRLKQLIYRRIS